MVATWARAVLSSSVSPVRAKTSLASAKYAREAGKSPLLLASIDR